MHYCHGPPISRRWCQICYNSRTPIRGVHPPSPLLSPLLPLLSASFPLLDLAPELILDIGIHLSTRTLFRLRNTCTGLRRLLTPLLRPHADYIALVCARKNLGVPLSLALSLGGTLPYTLVEQETTPRYTYHAQSLIREVVYQGLDQVFSVLFDSAWPNIDVESDGNSAGYRSAYLSSYHTHLLQASLLQLAVMRMHPGIAAKLLAHGAQVDRPLPGGPWATPLYLAVERSCAPLAKVLLDAGADVNFVTREINYYSAGESVKPEAVLLCAVRRGNSEIVRMVLETGRVDWGVIGGSPSRPALLGCRPSVVHVAVRGGNLEIVRALAEYGADLNVLEDGRGTALHDCVRFHRFEMAKVLLHFGAKVDLTRDMGTRSTGMMPTPLMMAVGRRNIGMVRLLLEYEQDVGWMKTWGWESLEKWEDETLRWEVENEKRKVEKEVREREEDQKRRDAYREKWQAEHPGQVLHSCVMCDGSSRTPMITRSGG